MITMKFNVRVSVADQARVFNVTVDTLCPSQCFDNVVNVVTRFAPKYCTVVVNKGCKAHRGKAISLLDLTVELKNLHFYHYVEMKREVEKFVPLATFYEKPFSVEYADYIGATFFNDINEKMITDVFTALDEVIPYPLHLAKSGSYYCWANLDYRWLSDGRWQLGRVENQVETVKVKKEYE